jgi:hypothetical protein
MEASVVVFGGELSVAVLEGEVLVTVDENCPRHGCILGGE